MKVKRLRKEGRKVKRLRKEGRKEVVEKDGKEGGNQGGKERS